MHWPLKPNVRPQFFAQCSCRRVGRVRALWMAASLRQACSVSTTAPLVVGPGRDLDIRDQSYMMTYMYVYLCTL